MLETLDLPWTAMAAALVLAFGIFTWWDKKIDKRLDKIEDLIKTTQTANEQAHNGIVTRIDGLSKDLHTLIGEMRARTADRPRTEA